MDFSLPLVAVIAGYVFLTRFNNTRYRAARSSGYHVFFQSAFWGILLFALSFVGLFLLYEVTPREYLLWASLLPDIVWDAVVVSVVLGILLPFALSLSKGRPRTPARHSCEGRNPEGQGRRV